MAWRPMSSVLNMVPRVVHPYDVKVRAMHVAGRDLHFVCGVSAHEFVGVGEDQGHFQLKKNLVSALPCILRKNLA
jgi:hypothetical protein